MTSRVAVIGGGITGLVAARELSRAGLQVTLLEASDRLGGQLHAVEAPGGVLVDVGAESVHLGIPQVAALIQELGLADQVVTAAPGASVLKVGRRWVPLPAGVGPTGPTRVMPVLKSRALSLPGLVRAGLEPLMKRTFPRDISVGAFVSHRFGQEVVDTFVDPLLGNLHSGNVHGLSLLATAPGLAPVARSGESLLKRALLADRAAKKAQADEKSSAKGSVEKAGSHLLFASWPSGLTRLTDELAAQCGAKLLTDSPVTSLARHESGWTVTHRGGQLEADQVVITTPTLVSQGLLEGICRPAVKAMEWVRTATVATVVLGYDPKVARHNKVLRGSNGVLLNTRQAQTFKAMTNLSRKWPTRFAQAEHHLIRVSVGSAQRSTVDSFDDDELVARCSEELGDLIGLTAPATFTAVHRWRQAMPQLAPGHLDRVELARQAATTVPGLHLAGAPFDGLGIGNTVKSGQRAARELLARLGQ